MRKYLIVTFLLLVHQWLLVNLRFTAWPEMFSFPYLINNGFGLYSDMVHPYPPLLTIILGKLFLAFGYKLVVLKLLTWALILASDLLIFFIVRSLTGSFRSSMLSLLIFIFLQPFLEGNMLWFDLAFVPFVLGGLFLTFKGGTLKGMARDNTYFAAGLLFTLAGFIKQNAFVFLVLLVAWFFVKYKNLKRIKYLLFAPLFIGSIFIMKLFSVSTLGHFFNWTLIFPSTFWTSFPGYVDMALSNKELIILVLLFVPIVVTMFVRRKLFTSRTTRLLMLFLIGSLLTVYPRFSFFHFQMALAMIATLYGFLLTEKIKHYPYFLAACIFALVFVVHLNVIKDDWKEQPRFLTDNDMSLYQDIDNSIGEAKSAYLLGLNSYSYVYSETLPPEPWLDNFGWYFEYPGVQEEVIQKWNENPPDVIIASNPTDGNWYDLGTYRPAEIVKWMVEEYDVESVEEGFKVWRRKN